MAGFRTTVCEQPTPQGHGRVILADPRGFCAGVDRAIQTVQTILDADNPHQDQGLPPVYVRRQIVHNRHVVEDLSRRGAVFVDELDQIPDQAVRAGVPVVFSAHGIAPSVVKEAQRRGMRVVDASCPLVSKVHREVQRFVRDGYSIIYIGHRGHDEAVGVMGEAPDRVHLVEHEADIEALDFGPETPLVMLTQTTLSLDETADLAAALRRRFPWVEEPPGSDICYATQNRQQAVKLVAGQAECMVVVGSANSSNSVRLVEVARQALDARFPGQGEQRAHRVDDAGELDPTWLQGMDSVGLTSGASVPENLVQGVLETLAARGFTQVTRARAVDEHMHFVLPAALRPARASRKVPQPQG